jgi:quercetin dioxygenase-like cupin family protein
MMDQAEFEASLRRDGYQIVPRSMTPNQRNDTHAHDFDARVLIMVGEMTVTCDGKSQRYRPGESFSLDAGRPHIEQAGAEGCAYIAGRRAAAS